MNTKTWYELKDVISEVICWCEDYNIIVPDGNYKNKQKKFTITNGKRHVKFNYDNGVIY
jgi:uncharacterized protein YxjI